jgi:phage pi2 protein 07
MKRDQAVIDRIGAQFSLIIGLASGIANAYRDFPFPIATVFTVLMSALTAVQQVAIMSAPLPPLAKGRKGGPATFARVGEVGTELIVDPSGAMSLTPPSESLAYLKEGTSVIPHHELVSMAKQRAMSADLTVRDGRPGYDMEKIISEVMNRTAGRLENAIKNIPKTAVKIDRDGISYLVNEAGNQWSYINRNIKQ